MFNAQARLRRIVDRSLPANDPDKATEELNAFLFSSVGDARYYSLLGTLARAQNRIDEADRLIRAALVLNPTEPNASIEQINTDIERGKFEDALDRADIYVRKGGHGSRAIAGHLVQLVLAKPEAREAIFSRLSTKPPWRTAFLNELFRTRDALFLVPEALQVLARSPYPATTLEARSAVNALLGTGDSAGAYRLFLRTLDEEQRKLVSLIYNPEFKAPPSGNAFDWVIANSRAAAVSVPAPAGDGALISFLKRPAVGFGLSQRLILAPGRYQGTLHISAASMVAPDTVHLYVRCANGRTLEKVNLPTGSYENRPVAFKFEVPEAGCLLQSIGFASGQLFEHWSRVYSGTLTINSVRIGAAED